METAVDELERELIEKSYYKSMDVVETVDAVKTVNARGRDEGKALPGWKWRIVGIRVQWTKGGAKFVVYECVSHDEPLAYRTTLRAGQIAKRVGRHEGEPMGRKL